MASESDLRHAISMRPSPFSGSSPSSQVNLHHHSPAPPVDPALPEADDSARKAAGHSTAYEPLTPPADPQPDPISRHVAAVGSAAANSGQSDQDVERQGRPQYSAQNDPFALSAKLKSPADIETEIQANTSRKRDDVSASQRSSLLAPLHNRQSNTRGRKLTNFYQSQNENIQRLLKPVDDHRREAKEEYGENELRYKIAVTGSFIANVLLAVLQLFAAIKSGSLSLFTTMADALFDPMSNITLILCNRAVKRVDGRKFPSGKARIETAGNIVFCFLMTAVSVLIIVQSVRELIEHKPSDGLVNKFYLESIVAVSVAFFTKLALFLYCFALRNQYSQVRILWEDHRNDLFINGTGVMFSLLGSKVRWFIDPMGAILISLLILVLWLRTAYSEFQLLIGVSADTNMLQLITYISMTHSEEIVAIDTVRAYYSGPRLIVEVDVVMDPLETLRHTHDVAEDLQIKLESLPNVERAYVHVDYETSHAPEHFLKKEL